MINEIATILNLSPVLNEMDFAKLVLERKKKSSSCFFVSENYWRCRSPWRKKREKKAHRVPDLLTAKSNGL